MPGSSNNSSFIPKRGTKKNTRKIRNLNIYILTIVSYVLFFAALGASAVAFFYSKSITNQLNDEIATMDNAIGVFKEADMLRVEEFDKRLRQANNRIDNSASIVRILTEIESAIVDSLRLNKLTIARDFDEGFTIQAQAETNNYDSAIFQRDILKGFEVIEEIEVRNVALQQVGNNDDASTEQSVGLATLLSVPLERVAYGVAETANISEEEIINQDSEQSGEVVETEEEFELFDVDTESAEGGAEATEDNGEEI